jgi:hypothetical protein
MVPIVTPEKADAALKRAMTSVKNLSMYSETTGGFSAPVCIVCNCLCDSDTLCWISRRAVFEKCKLLEGPTSVPAAVRAFYRYNRVGRQAFMNRCLLSPHATMKTVASSSSSSVERDRCISFSCCAFCEESMCKVPRFV